MSIITENMPRTIENKLTPKDKDRAKVARDTAVFLQAGGHIKDIPDGVGAYQQMSGPEYYASMQACATVGNQGRKKECLPIAKR